MSANQPPSPGADRLLAIDPALRNTGYAILEARAKNIRALDYGVIRNPDALTQSACLLRLHEGIRDLIARWAPTSCAVEGVIYVQSFRTAITLGAARGVILLAATQAALPIHEYAPRRVKQAVVGKGGAQKQQVGFMVRALLGLTENPPADAADALAIGLTHFRAENSRLPDIRKTL